MDWQDGRRWSGWWRKRREKAAKLGIVYSFKRSILRKAHEGDGINFPRDWTMMTHRTAGNASGQKRERENSLLLLRGTASWYSFSPKKKFEHVLAFFASQRAGRRRGKKNSIFSPSALNAPLSLMALFFPFLLLLFCPGEMMQEGGGVEGRREEKSLNPSFMQRCWPRRKKENWANGGGWGGRNGGTDRTEQITKK